MTHNTDPPQECQSQQEATTANQSLQRINEDVLQQIATALQQIADTQRSILHRLDAHETMSTDSRISLQSSRSYQSSASMRSLTTATRRTTLVARPTEQKPGRTKRTLPRTTKGDIITKIVNPNNDKDEEVVEGLVRTISSFADDAISDHARRCHGHDIPAATWARTPRQHRNTTIEYFQQTVLEKLNIDMTCAEKRRNQTRRHETEPVDSASSSRYSVRNESGEEVPNTPARGNNNQQHGGVLSDNRGANMIESSLQTSSNHVAHSTYQNQEQANTSTSQNNAPAPHGLDAINIRRLFSSSPTLLEILNNAAIGATTLESDAIVFQQSQVPQQSQGRKRRSNAENPTSTRRSTRLPVKRIPM
ncbi:hypothetical protein O0I10_012503 [Lichtheimia ornata]|uniref:Uncharacterized protein n=1 Tax=Lichtheimia ornata TaxID=688661 RepID=A0AAD7URL5_9FUNG|nr:uncharacterized protein O0I10_012503 [Lichtheimia ornata]KAJ8651898.1 hypothetical protein O0I10_012503 [Lichtheimia ornata]